MKRPQINLLIKDMAASLGVGQTAPNQNCPFCKSGEHSFSISRFQNGIVYNCFRAKCKAKGFVDTTMDTIQEPLKSQITERKRPPPIFNYPTRNFTKEEVSKYFGKYGITYAQVKLNQWVLDTLHNRVYMPILNFAGFDGGGVAKVLPESTWTGPDKVVYHSGVVPHIHYAEFDGSSDGNLVWCAVVEDIISSVKCSQFVETAALLGTSMSDAAANDLAAHYDSLLIMLDPGAEEQAMKIVKERKLQFKDIKVLFLKQDPKDTNKEELKRAIDGAINPRSTANQQRSVQ